MSNAFRTLLTFALDVHNRELQRAGGVDGGRWSSDALNWREDFGPSERELNELFAAAVSQAGRTGYPLPEVERRLRALQKHILAIMLWPRDAPRLTEEQRQEREAAGSWTGGPVSDYLGTHSSRMMDAWQEVEPLALRVEPGAAPELLEDVPPVSNSAADPQRAIAGEDSPPALHPPPKAPADPPAKNRGIAPRSAAPLHQDMGVLQFMGYWERQLRTGAGRHGPPEHYQLPEQGETANDRAALKLLRACCSGYFEAEKTVLAFLNLDRESQIPLVRSMASILDRARRAAASAILFDGEDIPTGGTAAETGVPEVARDAIPSMSDDLPSSAGPFAGLDDDERVLQAEQEQREKADRELEAQREALARLERCFAPPWTDGRAEGLDFARQFCERAAKARKELERQGRLALLEQLLDTGASEHEQATIRLSVGLLRMTDLEAATRWLFDRMQPGRDAIGKAVIRWLVGWAYRALLPLLNREDAPTAGAGHRPESKSSPNTGEAPAAPEGMSSEQTDKLGMTWQEAAKRLKRLRAQGEPWTSYRKLAEQLTCTLSVVYKAIRQTPELLSWAKRQTSAAPTAQSLNDAVTDRTAQSREPDPSDDAAIREYLERDLTPDERAFFNSLSREDQLDFLDDPDQHPKILGRKP